MIMPPAVRATLIRAAQEHGIEPQYMWGKSQEAPCVKARADAAYRLRKRGHSLTQIGRWLGGRHHATIMHLLKRYKPHPLPVDRTISVPDFSGEWSI